MSPANLFAELVSPKLVLPARPPGADGPSCPKCRFAGDVATSKGWTKYIWVSPDDAAQYNIRDGEGQPLGECLMVSCARCGYKWHEDVATPEEASKPS